MKFNRHRTTEQDRRHVQFLAAAGRTPSEIAITLNMPVRELRKRFGNELRSGSARIEATVIERLDRAGQSGNAASTRALAKIVQQARKAEKAARKAKAAAKPERVRLSKDEVALVAHLRSAIWEDALERPPPPRELLEKMLQAEVDGDDITERMHQRAREMLADTKTRRPENDEPQP